MDSNQPRGGYFENDLLESEAASALAHLAKVGGRNVEQQGQGATRTALSGASASSASNNSIGCSLSTTSWRVQQNKQTRLELENTTATSAIIKESVLRRLNNPQDIVKRNMFAVEGKSIKFPVKLMFLLDECEQFCPIISWTKDGLSFIIHDPAAFEDKVLPVIFKEARFSSFQRKLTRWGFLKKSTPFGMRFHQRKFRRGDYSMCIDITCASKACDIIRLRDQDHSSTSSSTTATTRPYSSGMTILEQGSASCHSQEHYTKQKREEEGRISPPSKTSSSMILNTTSTTKEAPPRPHHVSSLHSNGMHNKDVNSSHFGQQRKQQHLNAAAWLQSSSSTSSVGGVAETLTGRCDTNTSNNSQEQEIKLLKQFLSHPRPSFHPHDLNNEEQQRNNMNLRHIQLLEQQRVKLLRNRAALAIRGARGDHYQQQQYEDMLLSSAMNNREGSHLNLQQQHSRDFSSSLNNGIVPNECAPANLLQQQPMPSSQHQSLQQEQRRAIHSQVMSAALKGLMPSQQNVPHMDGLSALEARSRARTTINNANGQQSLSFPTQFGDRNLPLDLLNGRTNSGANNVMSNHNNTSSMHHRASNHEAFLIEQLQRERMGSRIPQMGAFFQQQQQQQRGRQQQQLQQQQRGRQHQHQDHLSLMSNMGGQLQQEPSTNIRALLNLSQNRGAGSTTLQNIIDENLLLELAKQSRNDN